MYARGLLDYLGHEVIGLGQRAVRGSLRIIVLT